MKKILTFSKVTKKILLVIAIITALSFLVAYLYYDSKNKSEDPRIVGTKEMFKDYDNLVNQKKYDSALSLLDSIECILVKVPGYINSYELGIVYNNRGSAILSKALYDCNDSLEKVKYLEKAKINIDSGIAIYTLWLEKNKDISKDLYIELIKPFFSENDNALKGKNIEKIINKRADDLVLAQKETPRRLSVSYTNLGIILRHQYKQEEAIESYIKAIKLWKDNYTARNNFNVLMGKPPEDRSIIDQLFPPEKNKFN